MHFLVVLLLALPTICGALRCFLNTTHTIECQGFATGTIPLLCYNQTVDTENGRQHTYGCASFFQRMIPRIGLESRSFCSNVDVAPWLGKGRVCICDTDNCNKHVHRKKHNVASGTTSSSLPKVVAMAFLFYLVIF